MSSAVQFGSAFATTADCLSCSCHASCWSRVCCAKNHVAPTPMFEHACFETTRTGVLSLMIAGIRSVWGLSLGVVHAEDALGRSCVQLFVARIKLPLPMGLAMFFITTVDKKQSKRQLTDSSTNGMVWWTRHNCSKFSQCFFGSVCVCVFFPKQVCHCCHIVGRNQLILTKNRKLLQKMLVEMHYATQANCNAVAAWVLSQSIGPSSSWLSLVSFNGKETQCHHGIGVP